MSGHRPQPWSEEEDARLLSMRRRHMSTEDIAVALGRSFKSVEARCFDCGIQKDGAIDLQRATRRRERRRVVRQHSTPTPITRPVPEPWQCAPPDTRDLTAYLCGDPIFERSALAAKGVGK